jgi:Fe-S-cluster-containing hydrogenase component 2
MKSQTLASKGVPSQNDISPKLPSESRIKEKGYAIIECFQEIPCNPCVAACPKGAIKNMENINEIPQIDFDICDGCGLCIALCPGLAIFAIDDTDNDKTILKIPHEFNPPEKGAVVVALDREGNEVSKVIVNRVVKTKSKTYVIWLETNKDDASKIRAIKIND